MNPKKNGIPLCQCVSSVQEVDPIHSDVKAACNEFLERRKIKTARMGGCHRWDNRGSAKGGK